MSINNKLAELKARRGSIEAGGGAEKTDKQHASGKLTARERINLLFDRGSFIELDAFTGGKPAFLEACEAPCDGVICGYGTVDQRPVFAYAQDFTVLGGSVGEIHGKKIAKVIDMALKTGAPIVAMLDSGGARIQEGSDALEGMGQILRKTALASGVVPQIAAVMGPCVGGASAAANLSDFVFMTKETSSLYMSGPSVIRGTTGESIDAADLGGAMANARSSGNCHVVCDNDESLLGAVRELLSYLPSNNLEDAPLMDTDDINRISSDLNTLIPDNDADSYDVRSAITEIADIGSVYEILPFYAQNIITAFGRLNGSTVGFVANQAASGGSLDCDGAKKAARFVRFCDCFNIPLVTLVDTDGYAASISQESSGISRQIAGLVYAYAEATVPKVSLVLRKAYGSAYIAMGSKHIGADMTYAWPTAQIAVMQAEGAANIIYRKELQQADDPIKARTEFVEAFKETFANPYEAARHGYVDDVIEPASTRPRIIAALLMLAGKRETLPPKKHGNMPF